MLEVAAESTRRRLLQLLAPGERTVTQLASRIPVTRSAISQHLAILAEVGLITARNLMRSITIIGEPAGRAAVGAR
jgi:DNA-binding transcriptional ArsR family regulator